MTPHHQARILLALVCERGADLERLIALAPADPATFAGLCREADVHPWAHERIRRDGHAERFAPSIVEALGRARHKVRQDNLLLLGRAEEALDRLGDAGVVPIALKGLDFLHRVYDGFDQRTSDDVDLLVRPEQLRTCLAVLEKSGWSAPPEPERIHYIRSSHHLPLRSPGPVPVDFEIHWNLAQERRYTVDVAGLFARALPLPVGGRKVLRLGDADIVAHLLIHHFSHYFDRRLKWLVDLRRLTARPDFDWTEVVARLREWDGCAAAAVSLRHLAKLDPDLFPPTLLEQLPVSPWRRLLTAPLRSSHPLEWFHSTARRSVQLYLAAVMLERPTQLPGWLLHRSRRDRQSGSNPLDDGAPHAGLEDTR